MRQSVKGLGSEKPFEIKEMEEKSHFSPPEPSQELPNNKVELMVSTKPVDDDDQKGASDQQHKYQQKRQINKESSNKKQISALISLPQHNELVECEQPQQNINLQFTRYTFAMYLGIFLYMCNFFIWIIPGLREEERIGRVTEVVLEVAFVLVLFLMVVSYEKARRANPGYPIGLSQMYKVQNAKLVLQRPQILQLKNHTMALLIKKAQLKQTLSKDPSLQNQQLYQQFCQQHLYRTFEYTFNVQQTKWCQKCNNIKKPRVRHCSQCNMCVERMDHHCVWLSNCVGRRNHKFFMLFLGFLIVILTFFVVVGVVEIVDRERGVGKYLEMRYGRFWKVVYVIGEVLATGLWLYYLFVFCEQLYLIFNNLTFVQSLTNILAQKKPWKKDSCCDNLRQVFGSGCWICPTKVKSTSYVIFGQEQNKKNPSVELVEEVLGGNHNQMTNFQSQHHFRNQRNQI